MRINPQCRFQNPRLFWTRLYNYMWRVTVRKQESYENVSGANASYMLKTTLKRILCNSLRVEIEIMQSNFLTETSRTPDKTVETFPQPPPQALRFSHDLGGERETRVTGDEAQETTPSHRSHRERNVRVRSRHFHVFINFVLWNDSL